MTEHWTVLVNPRSGRRRSVLERVQDALAPLDIVAHVSAPDGRDAMRAAVRSSIASGRDHVAVVGGDGSVSLVVDELMRMELSTAPIIAVIPAGSGSDFARPFAIPQNIEGAVHHLVGSTDYALDVGFVEGAWGLRAFINVAQAGLLAECVDLASRMARRVGRIKYQIAFWLTLPRFRSAEVTVTTDRRTYEGSALVAVFANGQFFGGGFNVAPKAALMDGIVDVQVFQVKRRQVPELFPKVKRGLHLKHPGVKRFRSSTFELTTSVPWLVEVDGDVIGSTPVRGWLEQGRLFLRL